MPRLRLLENDNTAQTYKEAVKSQGFLYLIYTCPGCNTVNESFVQQGPVSRRQQCIQCYRYYDYVVRPDDAGRGYMAIY